LLFHDIGYVPAADYGISAGMDVRLSGPLLLAPKITAEYRYVFVVARGGYQYCTDLEQHEHIPFIEFGLSYFGFVDLTYMRALPQNGDRFNLGIHYFNATFTWPITIYSR
jgi:hypothetical protein